MAREMMENRVFRAIESRWRGPLPCSWSELVVGLVVGVLASARWSAIVGGPIGLALTAILTGWRAMDHDRSDFFVAACRRFVRVRAYSSSEPDSGFAPFRPR